MLTRPASEPPSPPAAEARGEILVVVGPGARGAAGAYASALRSRVAGGVLGRTVTVLVPAPGAEGNLLVDPSDPRAADAAPAPPDLAAGGITGPRSALGAVLREADARGAVAATLVTGGRDESVDWLNLLLSPILDEGYEYVCPSYRRAAADGLLATAIVYPLTRALYGLRLRQPAGGEAAVSLALARHLLADLDWRRDPAHAGSDAWLIGKVLAERRRICQAWLGTWPGDGSGEDASHALARLVGPVFLEMERRADRWQRVGASEPVPSFGEPSPLAGDATRVDVAALAARFVLGLRELDAIWGLVLPPATRLALRRAAAAAPEALRIDDGLWARVVFDFAVAHYTRSIERGQLLRSMTPIYIGWVTGFVNDVRGLGLDPAGAEARVEALCAAFEREKSYLIGRWRWPDGFNP